MTRNNCKRQYTSQSTDDFRSRETTASLKVEVLVEENCVYKKICTNILKVNASQVFVATFL